MGATEASLGETLDIHLDQVGAVSNTVNGAPSGLLARIGLGSYAFGDIDTV